VLDKYVDSMGARCLGKSPSQHVVACDSWTCPDRLLVFADGSPPAFYIREGAESKSYIIDFCGGGWCYDEGSCLSRSGDALLGSSRLAPRDGNKQSLASGGLLSADPKVNPDFYNWT